MPSDLAEQVPLVHEACEALGVPVLTFARLRGRRRDRHAGGAGARGRASTSRIVTGDKDFFQLVGDGIRVYNPRDEGTWYDAAGVVEKFGVRPDQVVDVLALMGDSIDNIKGVPGIGEKGARELIAAHGSLDALLAAAPTIAQKRYREALARATPSRRASSRELARIRTDVPVTFDPDALRYRGPSRERCYALFSSLGFRTLVAGVRADGGDRRRATTRSSTSLDEVDALAAALRGGGPHRRRADRAPARRPCRADRRLGVLAPRRDRRATFRWRTRAWPTRRTCRAREVFARLGPVLADPAIAKIGHDLKFVDDRRCAREGVDARRRRRRHDGRELPARRDAIEPRHRRPRARARGLPRASTEEDVTGKGVKARGARRGAGRRRSLTFAGERADLPLTLAPGLADDLEHGRPRRGLSRSRAAADSGARGHRARRRQRRHRRRSPRSAAAMQAELDELCAADLRARRRRVQHQLAEAARRRAVRAS